ncbi:MAG: hypothetical protein H7274_18835, partial [Rhodoferax sp.]|nr:hypothetical protein [Rhodoferax sp.]
MPLSEDDRRAYWIAQLEDAYQFMFDSILHYPVEECGEGLVSLREASAAAGVEVLFADASHVCGLKRLFYLRQGQIAGFVAAAREMNQRGWVLRVEDGYRTREIQKHLGRLPQVFDAVLKTVMWELKGQVPTAQFMFRRCSCLVASVPKFATHMSGSAIDISVLYRDAPATVVDRGAPYIEMSALTPMDSPFVSAQAQHNRRDITALMRRHGFVAYPFEFWHYSSGDAYDQFLRQTGGRAIYGAVDWNPETHTVTALADLKQPLNSEQEV